MARVRWTCAAAHPGVLAPSRMRRDDWRRVCVPCSEAAGRIVLRTAPTLERIREARKESAKAKARRIAASGKRRRTARLEVRRAYRDGRDVALREAPGGDMAAELARLWPIACRLSSRDDIDPVRPPALVHRVGRKGHTSGHARYDGTKIVVTVGVRSDAAEALTVLAHEVSHAAAPIDEHHGPGFWRLHCDLVREAYGADPNISKQTTKWGRHVVIAQAVREARVLQGI